MLATLSKAASVMAAFLLSCAGASDCSLLGGTCTSTSTQTAFDGTSLLQSGLNRHVTTALGPHGRKNWLPRLRRGKMMHVEQEPSLAHLPLCHPTIIQQTCRRLNGGQDATTVKVANLREILSAENGDVRLLLQKLRLNPVHGRLSCARVCKASVRHFLAKGIRLPPASDLACYSVGGREDCDVNVSPTELIRSLGRSSKESDNVEDAVAIAPDGQSEDPSSGAKDGVRLYSVGIGGSVNERVTAWASAEVAAEVSGARFPSMLQEDRSEHRRQTRSARRKRGCPYEARKLLSRMANLFRIFPVDTPSMVVTRPEKHHDWKHGGRPHRRSPESLIGDSADSAADSVEVAIEKSNAKAKAWMSAVILEMQNMQTAAFRAKWFGGAGFKTEADIRSRVLRTMNYVEREFMDGIRYIYPADSAQHTACSGNVVAYVWKYASEASAYKETHGPVCDDVSAAFRSQCGIDKEGRLFVYLCRRWYESIESDLSRVSILVHEAAHHTGPSDVTYDKVQMRALSQADQLHNAANYQYFAEEVTQAAWGCADATSVTDLPFTCTPAPCHCASFASLCYSSTWGAQIRERCPATCGACNAPPATGTSNTMPATTTTTTTTTTKGQDSQECQEPGETIVVGIGIGSEVTYYKGTCSMFGSFGYCQYPEVSEACPVSCHICGATQVPHGCEDDATFSIQTGLGTFTCENWRYYTCWEDVKPHCPTACEVPGC
eukprot:CAMPEP_0176131438 /NCGR_PEP_ID=MMETSP0120_2-20121206/66540_1 /TAXON_ID=160619 /ORGANISM="Kryptoperidinium foliaceum, Strain CCMP 1326" /LENGTH=719 /DNA_ID=CAMNT_0017466813 /DNA_START=1 /DNA_END=2160 /DNA_ORIENTATION=+